MPEFKLATNENNKATELKLCTVTGSVEKNPHMRAFWASTISFFLAFLGWFALAPLAMDVAYSMGICENQLFPPQTDKKRLPYLKFKNINTLHDYCVHGIDDPAAPTDCKSPSSDILSQRSCSDTITTNCVEARLKKTYDADVFPKCVCVGGTKCRQVLGDAGVASVASTIFVRVALGTLLERFGPVNVQSLLLTFGAIWVAAAAGITAPWNFTLIRFMIGTAGASFVTNQFWCSLMFAPNIVGTANATAAGWGNLGGGVTQVFMVVVLFNPFMKAGLAPNVAWRVAMIVPAVAFLITALCMKLLCWDTPTKKRFTTQETGKVQGASMWDYVEVLKDIKVIVMIFQYSACFGTELAMNNQLATHFRSYFQMEASHAATLASAFGGMNLFARSLGGISSDLLYKRFGFPGRLWAQFLALFFEAIFLFVFGCINNSMPWYVALIVLILFSTCVQMAEGTSYGIVPFMNRQQLAIVSALVGAGGNLGAVIAGFCFYKPINDDLLPFKIHAVYVMFWTLLSPVYYWPELGGMFSGPKAGSGEDASEKSGGDAPEKEENPSSC